MHMQREFKKEECGKKNFSLTKKKRKCPTIEKAWSEPYHVLVSMAKASIIETIPMTRALSAPSVSMVAPLLFFD